MKNNKLKFTNINNRIVKENNLFILVLFLLVSCYNKPDPKGQVTGKMVEKLDVKKLNGKWQLIETNDTVFNIRNIYTTNNGGPPTLNFNLEINKIGGFTGCNAWGAKINFSSNSLVINDTIEMTQQGCQGNWENRYMNLLRNNKSYELINENLKLTSKNGETMIFKKIKNDQLK